MEQQGRMNLAVDFGEGRKVDVEVDESNQPWIVVGPDFAGGDLWLNAGAGMIDLRVIVRRSEAGIEILVDRGDGQQRWWSSDTAPRLAIAVDALGSKATAIASVGSGTEFQQVLLGQTEI